MNCFFRNQHEALFKATKPYQYVGGEFFSYNKNWESTSVRFTFVFPDKYEIGISNLGVRIIYDRVNKIERFLADRSYAPEPDFKPDFLYGVESKRALKDFDGIGFSLQYELSYPTVLKMLEMSGVGVKNTERGENEPIVFAGGPCAFNPLPLSDFIDVFCIGDGEDMMVEVCEVLEKTKSKSRRERIEELCKIEGCWSLNATKSHTPQTCVREQECEGSQELVPLAPCGRGARGEGSQELVPLAPCGRGARGEGSASLKKAAHFYTLKSLEYSKELRKNMTEPECILWYYLRNKQLNNMKFRRQEAIGNYIVDFVCYDKKLILELDGGGHTEKEQIEHDKIRDKFLEEQGFKVLRIYNNDVYKNIEGVIDYILMNTFDDPSPHPSPTRGEGVYSAQPYSPCDSPTRGEGVYSAQPYSPCDSPTREKGVYSAQPYSPCDSPTRGEGVYSAQPYSPCDSPTRGEGVYSAQPYSPCDSPTREKGAYSAQPYSPCDSPTYKNKNHFAPVNKRISPLTLENASTSYPIPFSSSVHDRAIVEIRRGCGRMCRFCQPGHVTLPIREREAEDIIKITKELVDNTGYNEYSLLSLSSNDYSNINEVIKELSVDFNKRKINVSLPSQRIDGFSLELANLMQSVRKSGMTLAPEAGSQRLRNVIKKNISEEQIINAALTLYENGWNKLKFYFIAGLPTETLQDMDEMAELLGKIKYKAKQIKKEKELSHGFEITCTVSIFVPKPFTPFQWCGQADLSIVSEHIKYLKEKTKNIKGLKINYHESFVSQIEAVLTRGDRNLCEYIYALYKKGCYLDAWGEYFDKNVWNDTAKECGLSLSKLAQKEYDLTEELPWDFVNVGLSKEWLQKEYELAMMQGEVNDKKETYPLNFQKTCEQGCVNCGVCTNLQTKKVLAKPYKASEEGNHVLDVEPVDPTRANIDPNIPVYRYRLKITKKGLLKYFSHLDWQNTFHKCLARTGLNIVYTLGFNPTMKVSMGIALPLFAQSEGELVDIEIYDKISEKDLTELINSKLPEGAKVVGIKAVERYAKAVDVEAQWAEYKITPYIKNTPHPNPLPQGERELTQLDHTYPALLPQGERELTQLDHTYPALLPQGERELTQLDHTYPALLPQGEREFSQLDHTYPALLPQGKRELTQLDHTYPALLPQGERELTQLDHTYPALLPQGAMEPAKDFSSFSPPLYNFEKFMYDVNRVLSSDSILITKKNKKGLEKTTDFKKSIGSYRFESNSLFIHLKVGQGSDIPALRSDDLMKLISPDQIFEIIRIKFLDENLNEM